MFVPGDTDRGFPGERLTWAGLAPVLSDECQSLKCWDFLPFRVPCICLLNIMLYFQGQMGMGRNLKLKNLYPHWPQVCPLQIDRNNTCFRALWRFIKQHERSAQRNAWPLESTEFWWLPSLLYHTPSLIFPDLHGLLPYHNGFLAACPPPISHAKNSPHSL